jgi:hypothetical protein
MIDPLTEDVILPSEATRIFPKGPNGKHPHVSFIYRAMKTGCRGVVLESIRTPRLATSRQAVARFLQRLSASGRPTSAPARGLEGRERANREVEIELDRIGI